MQQGISVRHQNVTFEHKDLTDTIKKILHGQKRINRKHCTFLTTICAPLLQQLDPHEINTHTQRDPVMIILFQCLNKIQNST